MFIVKIKVLILAIAGGAIIQAADNSALRTITNSPLGDLNGQTITIQGTAQQIWGTENLRDPRLAENPAILNYLRLNPPSQGIVYYGKVEGRGYLVHESWLGAPSQASLERRDASAQITSGRTPNGGGFVGPAWFVARVLQADDPVQNKNSQDSDKE